MVTAPRTVTATAPSSPESSGRLPTRRVEFGGIAPEAAVLAIRQSSMRFRASDAAGGDGVGDVESLAAAVRAAAVQGATVINVLRRWPISRSPTLSMTGRWARPQRTRWHTRNVVVVAAAGNVGGRGTWPETRYRCPIRPAGLSWDRVDVVAGPSWYGITC